MSQNCLKSLKPGGLRPPILSEEMGSTLYDHFPTHVRLLVDTVFKTVPICTEHESHLMSIPTTASTYKFVLADNYNADFLSTEPTKAHQNSLRGTIVETTSTAHRPSPQHISADQQHGGSIRIRCRTRRSASQSWGSAESRRWSRKWMNRCFR